MGGQFINGNAGGPFVPYVDVDNAEGNLKLYHDRYEVFVNGDFVGRKVLLNGSDNVSDVDDFLKSRGIENFTTRLDGDHYIISVQDQSLAGKVKDQLNVHLHIR